MRIVKQILKKLDIYGKQIEFTKEFHPQMKTTLGGILTLVSVGFFAIFFYLNALELSLRETPNTLSYNKLEKENIPIFEINPKTFPFSISVIDRNGTKLEKEIVTVSFMQQILTLDLATQRVNIDRRPPFPTVPCSAQNFDPSYNLTMQSFFYLQYCVPPNGVDLKIGNTEDNILSFKPVMQLQIVVGKCRNNTNSTIKCASDEEINRRLDEAQVVFAFGTNFFTSKNYENPFQNVFSVENEQVNPFQRKDIISKLRVNRVRDDYGYFYSLLEEKMGFNSLSSKLSVSPTDPIKQEFYFRNIAFEPIVNYYDRLYIKIYQVLAQSKVTLDIIIIVFQVFMGLYTKEEMNACFLNCLYSFPSLTNKSNFEKLDKIKADKTQIEKSGKKMRILKENEKDKNEKFQQFDSESKPPTSRKIKMSHLDEDDETYSIFKQELKKIKLAEGKIKFNIFELTGMIFCSCCKWVHNRYNVIYYTLLKNEIMEKFEFVHYLKVCEELKKIKMLLFTKEQYNVAEFLSKPAFPQCHEEKYNKLYYNLNNNDLMNKNFVKSLKKISSENDLLSKNILSCLDENLLYLKDL